MHRIWSYISNINIHYFQDPEERQRMRLVNQMIFLNLLAAGVDLTTTAYINLPTLWIINVPSFLGLFLSFQVHRLGSRLYSILFFNLFLCTQIYLLENFYKHQLQLSQFYLPFALVQSLFLKKDEKLNLIAFIGIPIAFLALATFFRLSFSESRLLSEADMTFAQIGIGVNTVLIISLFLYALVHYKETIETKIGVNDLTLKAIIDNTQDSIWSLDKNYCLIAFNRVFDDNYLRLMGKHPQIGLPIFQEQHDRQWQVWKSIYDRGFAGENYHQEIRISYLDGTFRTFEVSVAPVLDANEEVIAITVYGKNLEERLAFESDLQRRQKEWEELTKAVPGVVYQIRGDVYNARQFTYLSPKAKEILGVNPNDIFSGRIALDSLIHEEDREKARLAEIKALQLGTEFATELRINTKEGPRWMYVRSNPMHDKQKTWTGLIFDIHERKTYEEQVKRTNTLLESINRNINEGLFRWSTQRGLIYCNNAAAQIFGYEDAHDLKNNGEKSALMRPEKEEALLQQLRKTGNLHGIEVELINRNGEPFTALMSGYVTTNQENELVIDGSIRDITQIKKYESELMKARDRAEEANRAKANFLSTMSHEIRTPLNAIIGLSDLLKDHSLPKESGEFVESIYYAAQNLLDLVNDILDYSKIEANKLSFNKVAVDLGALLKSSEKTLYHLIKEKAIHLDYQLDPELPKRLVLDPVRLNQILNNLVSNAIKFTPAGKVVLKATWNKQKKLLIIDVTDTGIGIAESDQQGIFDLFFQAQNHASEKSGGTGLGLTITRKLLEMQGGSLELIHSQLGVGSHFRATLHAQEVEPENTRPEHSGSDAMALAGKKVLIAEDNPVNALVTTKILEQWGCQVFHAENGQKAVIAYQRFTPDIVLMDLQMPVMTGQEAAKILLQNPNCAPIIALTADALETTRNEVIELGMKDFVSKPFNKEELLAKIVALLPKK